jgi:integrase
MIQSTGSKSYFWARRVHKKLEWHTIGNARDFSVDQARTRADSINAAIGKWKEAGAVGPTPVAKVQKHDSLTLEMLFDDYCKFRLAKDSKNPVKAITDTTWFFNAYLKTLHKREIASLTRRELQELHASVGEKNGKTAANRGLQLVKRVINFGIDSERFAGGNVAAKIDLYREESRERVLQDLELKRLLDELRPERESSRDLRDFVKLSLATGVRKSDILSMKWDDVRLEDHCWRVPPTTKTGKAYDCVLIPIARAVLAERAKRRTDKECPFVFPGRGVSGHVLDLKKGFNELLKRAHIANLHQHDLRRTFGSLMLRLGANETVVAKSLGHSVGSKATAIYTRVNFETQEAAAERVGERLLALTPQHTKRSTTEERLVNGEIASVEPL